MNLSVVIPCLNEEKTIKKSVLSAQSSLKKLKLSNYEIIVADNGSVDKSLEILQKLKFVKVINVPIRGYGAALHWGILKSKYEYVLFADGDLSYNFNETKKFLKVLEKQQADLILGSRFKGKINKDAMPFLNRYLGTPVLTFLINFLYKINTTDSNSGMRLINKKFYKKLKMKNSGMEWASELLIRSAKNDGRYIEVPIRFYKDKRGRRPHLIPWSDGWRHLKAIVLLKPNTLLLPVFIFGVISFYLVKFDTKDSFFLVILTIAMFFSFIAVKVLDYAINESSSWLVRLIQKSPISILAIFMTGLWFVVLFIAPYRGTLTNIIGSFIVIFDMWVFLVETIKTHLVNRLPDKL